MKFADVVKTLSPWLAVAVVIGYLRFHEPAAGLAPSPLVDAAAVELGRKYRTSFDAAGVAPLDAVAHSTATSTSELARTQRDALDAALKAASADVAAELTRRFGPASSGGGNVEAVKSFYRGLAEGYRKGPK